MKKWEDLTDTQRLVRSGVGSLGCGCLVVFLPKFIPAVGFVNTLAQFVLMVIALLLAASAGVYLQQVSPENYEE